MTQFLKVLSVKIVQSNHFSTIPRPQMSESREAFLVMTQFTKVFSVKVIQSNQILTIPRPQMRESWEAFFE